LLALLLTMPALAQGKKKAKKPTAKPAAHSKATPEQIRRFNELQKKR